MIAALTEALVITVGTFGLCFILYEYAIKRVGGLRFLFGLKPKPKKVFRQQPNAAE